jgi:hypothetical protein
MILVSCSVTYSKQPSHLRNGNRNKSEKTGLWPTLGIESVASPNLAVKPVSYSVRSCLAPTSRRGSPRAFGMQPHSWSKPPPVVSARSLERLDIIKIPGRRSLWEGDV